MPAGGIALLITGSSPGAQPWRAAFTASRTLADLTAQIDAGSVDMDTSDMPTVEVGGYAYIGYLSIPGIGRELPVMTDWSDEKLKVSPCRYYGSIQSENMVLAAHNYSGFFGRLKELSAGAKPSFTGADGQTRRYVVAEIYIQPPSVVGCHLARLDQLYDLLPGRPVEVRTFRWVTTRMFISFKDINQQPTLTIHSLKTRQRRRGGAAFPLSRFPVIWR